MKKQFPIIDIWLFQFSLAGYYGNSSNPIQIYENGTRHHIIKFLFYQSYLMPKVSVPFASFVFFCKEYNNYLNDYRVKLSSLLPLSKFQIHIPFYGMEIAYSKLDSRNLIENYEKLYLDSKTKVLPILSFPGELELIELIKNLVKNGYNLKYETVIQFFDYDKLLLIDSSHNRFEFLSINNIDESKIAGILPSEEFVNYLKTPWGGDTLNITASFIVKNEDLWKLFLHAREVMYKR